jgi:hypothetical protein
MSDLKDVHTEHCCEQHGCKYGNPTCPVEMGEKPQSFLCERCDSDRASIALYLPLATDDELRAEVMRRWPEDF